MKMFIITLLLIIPALLGCGREKENNNEVLVRINEFQMPLAEFQERLAAEIRLKDDFQLTLQAKKQFLEESIDKELLVQEAKKQHLDTKKDFIQAMNRYWESTLIRDLLAIKSKEIAGQTYVTQEEIKALYHEAKNKDNSFPPFAEIKNELQEQLLDQKMSQAMEKWLKKLRADADIEIHHDLL